MDGDLTGNFLGIGNGGSYRRSMMRKGRLPAAGLSRVAKVSSLANHDRPAKIIAIK